jgi:Protein of unknown function (DUF3579)
MFENALEIVIVGTTASGRPFRPSDWSDRLCGMMSVFSEDRHLSYSPYLKPVISAGVCCVVIDRELERIDPVAYRFLLSFANDNELTLRPGRKAARPEDALPAASDAAAPNV